MTCCACGERACPDWEAPQLPGERFCSYCFWETELLTPATVTVNAQAPNRERMTLVLETR